MPVKKPLFLLLIVLFVGGAGWAYYANKPSVHYVMYASADGMNSELRMALLSRLKANNIPYQTDKFGSILIPEKEVEKAVSCCS
ncbi:hypothetical protein D3P08_20350 [Paenibacillus nanensis]|uniref:Uncharacterized protein n=1 Tax=Paenibacillus nanensis TaxID=393251 RepID=A0A3A1UNR5_9BACL|nr:hypothetical protein [Paenibacillus nanensis]RIX50207.1 hypothetical protein D3P08_20350 [Paenibacillus nanensis]